MLGAVGENFKALSTSPRELWAVYALKLLESYGYFSGALVLTMYLSEEFGMDDIEAGKAYGIYGALVSLYGFLVGFLIDNLGVKQSLFMGFSLVSAGRLAFALTTQQWVAKLCLFLVMPMGSAMGIPVLMLSLKRYTSETSRGFAFGIFYVVMNVAAIINGYSVDAIRSVAKDGMEVFGMHMSPLRLVNLSAALCSVVGLLVVLPMREIRVEGGEAAAKGEVKAVTIEKASPWKIISELVRMTTFWRFMAITLICIQLKCLFRYLDALLPKFLAREHGDDVPFGLISTINPTIILVLVPFISAVTSSVKPYTMVHFGSFFTGFSPLPLMFSVSIPATISFIGLLSLGEAFWSPRFYDLTVSMAPEGREGTFVALGNAPLFLAKLPVGILSGWLLQEYCPPEGPRDSTMMWSIIFFLTVPAPIFFTLFKSCLGSAGTNSETPEPVEGDDMHTLSEAAVSGRDSRT